MLRTSAITDYGKYAEDVTNAYMQNEKDNQEYNEIKEKKAIQHEISKCKADYPKHQPPVRKPHKVRGQKIGDKFYTIKELKEWNERIKAEYDRKHAEEAEKAKKAKEAEKTAEKASEQVKTPKPTKAPEKTAAMARERTPEKEPVKTPEPVKIPKKTKEKEGPVIEVPNLPMERKVEKVKAIEDTMIRQPAEKMIKELQNQKVIPEEKTTTIKILSRATVMKQQMAYRDRFEEELFGSKTQEKTAKKGLVLHRRMGKGLGKGTGR